MGTMLSQSVARPNWAKATPAAPSYLQRLGKDCVQTASLQPTFLSISGMFLDAAQGTVTWWPPVGQFKQKNMKCSETLQGPLPDDAATLSRDRRFRLSGICPWYVSGSVTPLTCPSRAAGLRGSSHQQAIIAHSLKQSIPCCCQGRTSIPGRGKSQKAYSSPAKKPGRDDSASALHKFTTREPPSQRSWCAEVDHAQSDNAGDEPSSVCTANPFISPYRHLADYPGCTPDCRSCQCQSSDINI